MYNVTVIKSTVTPTISKMKYGHYFLLTLNKMFSALGENLGTHIAAIEFKPKRVRDE